MADRNFMVHLNLNNNQLLNARLQVLATPPVKNIGDEAFVYYNNTDKTVYAWTGNSWIDLGQSYTHPTFTTGNIPSTTLTGAKVISSVTVNNGHVTNVTTRDLTPADIGAAAANHTHLYSQITGIPSNTILGNNTGSTGAAKALTVGDMLTMLGIAQGEIDLLNAGTDTAQRTWTAKDINNFVLSKIENYLTEVNLAVTTTADTATITNTAGTNVTIPSASATKAGVLTAKDKVKLDSIEDGANRYVHPILNPGTHPFATELTSGLKVLSQMVVNNEGHVVTIKGRDLTAVDLAAVLLKDAVTGTGTTWSSTKINQVITDAVAQASTGALQYIGEYNPVTNTPPVTTDTSIKTGYTYVISADGTFAGEGVEVGDMIIAKKDNPGATRANWQIVNKNIPAIVDATTTVKGLIQLATSAEATAGTNTTKAITPATLKAVLDARVGGYAADFGDGSSLLYTIAHGQNSQDVIIQIQRKSDRAIIECDTKATSATTVTVGVNVAPASNAYRVIIKK